MTRWTRLRRRLLRLLRDPATNAYAEELYRLRDGAA